MGYYTDVYYRTRGFLLSGGSYTTLTAPSAGNIYARGINASGQIVGYYFGSDSGTHGFLLSGSSFTTFDAPSATATFAYGINQAGQIVGSFGDSLGEHGFLASPSTLPPTFAWHGPFSITTGVSGNPSFIQALPGTYGTMGNYELVVPLQSGGIAHYYRDNDDPNLPWYQTAVFATELGSVQGVSLIQSNYSTAGNGPGNLAVVALAGDALAYYFRDDTGAFAWNGPSPITTGVAGIPSFIQALPGTYGTMGNFELVVPLQSGGIAHYYRDNDDPNLPWYQTAVFATELGSVQSVSLIQSNYSTVGNGPGNLAVVALAGDALYYYYRDDGGAFAWNGPFFITNGVTGNPSFIQALPGTYGTMGDYELVVPLQNGGIGHFYRDNDNPSNPWYQTAVFGAELGSVQGVSLIQSNYSTAGNGPGNLSVVSVANNELDHFYRDDE